MGKCTVAWFLFISVTLRVAHLQTFPVPRLGIRSCERLSESDLLAVFGSSEAAGSIVGIVPTNFGTGDQGRNDPPVVQILTVNLVCEASGMTRDSVSSISAIIEYLCLEGSLCSPPLNTPVIEQYRLDCETDINGVPSFSDVRDGTVRTATVGNLTTPFMDQCGQCVNLPDSDPASQCSACDDECVGLGKCLGSETGQCCNYYYGSDCVITCPEGLEPNAQFECDCGLLTADNVEIEYSNFQFVDSTATETCDSDNGYTGTGVRTCTADIGWSGNAVTCTFHDCGTNGLTAPTNGQLSLEEVEPTSFGSMATFVCNPGFSLVSGDEMRTCELSGWSGTNPECDVSTTQPSPTESANASSPCGTPCIVGIVFAVLGAIILAAILAGVAYAIYTYMNHPDTKLAKYDPDNINGVAKDNPLYVDPDAVVGAEAA